MDMVDFKLTLRLIRARLGSFFDVMWMWRA